ncbi:MAG: ergothioneine biosynthesis protein EgtB [Gemmatimonadales bacterium]
MTQSAILTSPPLGQSAPLAVWFREVRAWSTALAEPLEVEDCVVSSMPDVSPTKWHLAHTSWFFETFVLAPHSPAYRSPDPRYAFLFNSYYVQAGERHCRAQRGLVTRPTLAQVLEYRRHVDEAVLDLLESIGDDPIHPASALIELGTHHEQQHQELMLTDIKHVLWMNPLRPAYREAGALPSAKVTPLTWVDIPEGVHEIGYAGDGFAFDSESPRHRVYLQPARIASRLVTNAEYQAFVDDGGYSRAELWLSAGFATVQAEGWTAPLYWDTKHGQRIEFTLGGERPLAGAMPVVHVSYYEADAYSRWAGASLPTEAEWEVAAADSPVAGTFAESRVGHPRPAPNSAGASQWYGDAWQWTGSPYVGYPGYRAATGALGEYNGKWMADQWILRGAYVATPQSHARLTYRNFFPSPTRWQFAGIRLAERA